MTQRGRNEARDPSDNRGKTNIVQNKNTNLQGKPSPGTTKAGADHVKRSWFPWRRHSDKLAQNNKHNQSEAKKQKCKPGKPCKAEEKLAQKGNDNLKCIHGPCKVCPPGFSLNKKGVCVSTPQNPTYDNAYNCTTDPLSSQNAGRPCNSNSVPNNCSALASEVQQEEMYMERIQNTRLSACSQSASSQECLELNTQYQKELLQLEQLRREYEACLRR